MQIILTTIMLTLASYACAQDHKSWVAKIDNVEDANKYAVKHSDVIVSIVNYKRDKFLFDGIDTNNLAKHNGELKSSFGRATKFLKDTAMHMVDVQIIRFEPSSSSNEIRPVLVNQIEKRLIAGDTYWDVKKKFNHTSAEFWSGPEYTKTINLKYQIDLTNAKQDQRFEIFSGKERVGFLIVKEVNHSVPAFYAIAYNELR